MIDSTVLSIAEREVDQGRDVEPMIRRRQPRADHHKIVYRMIGLSTNGTYLFDQKNDTEVAARFICRLKADFLCSFITNMLQQQSSVK